ncbi:hypothetical protein GLOIN_2v1485104 [Rhizophagus irregularis DAOM 181602=DAOM 197198]|uniref:Uncharacterized protein n=1 Tax=Rhizophagus irregularis (strain DAOM 181602 / DAOM 197198 / MUCL 43194) TaxID=747089 RepID=A0A2P4PBW2_RHIID|nr:hypothetical protein GLOIN_2v1485104 [Rhizophagus irregularis DAOM 181602=DAOM 197198]POG62876.1 hypothetical protein GLOIN_2v1485104 [Rhizophagus irregularis DAOM 181602=DAOM 197198]|eukprot:XP_025169742.1 hypothetical protein GLOIN_2v1485104 [Rhizophagus irregularis DAOM 181602=DAOM 197198]
MSLSALSESVVAYNIDLYSHLWSYGSKKATKKNISKEMIPDDQILKQMSLSALSESVVTYNIDLYSHLWSYESKKATKKNISKAMIPDDQILKQMSLSALSESVVAYNIDLYSHLWSYGPKKPSRKFQTPCEMTKKNFNTHNITILSLSWLQKKNIFKDKIPDDQILKRK